VSSCMAGTAHLAASGGRWCYEVEVLEAEPKGNLYVGLAGSNLTPQCSGVGGDACSWGIWDGGDYVGHGCTAMLVAARRAACCGSAT
jgi:hypothetical protein